MTMMEAPDNPAALVERVVVMNDLRGLDETERMAYYAELCSSLGLNPLSRPFEYIVLDGRLTLYATRSCTDQLRTIRGISITSLEAHRDGDLYIVKAEGHDRTGRQDKASGVVSIQGLRGNPLANAIMRAETKAKRRLTLSLAGLGFPDESEVVPDADPVVSEAQRPNLAAIVAGKVDAIAPGPPSPAESVDGDDQPFTPGGASFHDPAPTRRDADPDVGIPAGVVEAFSADDVADVDTVEAFDFRDDDPPAADVPAILPDRDPPGSAGVTRDAFADELKRRNIEPQKATALRKNMFPDLPSWAEVTDEQRATILAELVR